MRSSPHNNRTPMIILTGFILLLVAAAGCSQQPAGNLAGNGTSMPMAGGPGGCTSPDTCTAYCQQHTTECDQYCRNNPDTCRNGGTPAQGGAGASVTRGFETSTACDTSAVKGKMAVEINRILVSPPETVRAPNWQTKILPATNPYPGYYYDLSTAFGPAIDSQKTGWNGMGEPPRTPGLDYYIIGYWQENPKGSGGNMGEKTPDSIDLSQHQLAVFFTNVTGKSQAGMIDALPPLTMSEQEAKAFFASKIKKSFISLDNKALTRSGNQKMYEVSWHDSANTQDYWNVQIGTGYIAIGQGKVYTAEAQLQGDPGTIWRYHACKPCINCDDWTVGTSLNRDCSQDRDCLGGLACSAGYCVDPRKVASAMGTPAIAGQVSGGPAGTGAPGSSCSSYKDCASGLSCRNGACAIPTGPS